MAGNTSKYTRRIEQRMRAAAAAMDYETAASLRDDLQALENAQSAMNVHAADIDLLTSTFFADFSALDFGGD